MPRTAIPLLTNVVCPHCWEEFKPADVLFVGGHDDLLGDPKLGPSEYRRFPPTRFTPGGEAIDPSGFRCSQMACPNCHLIIPRSCLEMRSLFFSIFGSPGSGKSYYLAAMAYELKQKLRSEFAVDFRDADPTMNSSLTANIRNLFQNPSGSQYIPLGDLIHKTEEQGDLYNSVSFGNQDVIYSRPFLFNVMPDIDDEDFTANYKRARMLCLYDNAGESFLPGADRESAPVTRHLAQSKALLFVFDPTQNLRIREAVGLPQKETSLTDQDSILNEAAARVRRFSGLSQTQKHDVPLIVVLTKSDVWSPMLENNDFPEPFKEDRRPDGTIRRKLDTRAVEARSQQLKGILHRLCPEVVNAAEGFARSVTYIPTSAVGMHVEYDEQQGLDVIRPNDTDPSWVSVPFLYAVSQTAPELLDSKK